MSQEFGGFLSGLNYVVRALSGGRVLVESSFNKLLVKTHNGASTVGSALTVETIEPIATADATATAFKTIAVPLGAALGGTVHIVGKKTGAADSYVGRYLFSAVNNGATVAEIAAESGTALENSAGTPAVTVVADDTADTIVIKVAGIAAEDWKWLGWIEYASLTYA